MKGLIHIKESRQNTEGFEPQIHGIAADFS